MKILNINKNVYILLNLSHIDAKSLKKKYKSYISGNKKV